MRLALFALNSFMNGDGYAFPSQKTLAAAMHMSEKSAQKAVRAAIKAGWLLARSSEESGKGWKRYEYQASVPDALEHVVQGLRKSGNHFDITSADGPEFQRGRSDADRLGANARNHLDRAVPAGSRNDSDGASSRTPGHLVPPDVLAKSSSQVFKEDFKEAPTCGAVALPIVSEQQRQAARDRRNRAIKFLHAAPDTAIETLMTSYELSREQAMEVREYVAAGSAEPRPEGRVG